MNDSNSTNSDQQNFLTDALKNFQFDVAWGKGGLPSDGVGGESTFGQRERRSGFRGEQRGAPRRDRGHSRARRDDRGSQDRFHQPAGRYDRQHFERPVFAPIEAGFQPEAVPFKSLVQAMKASKRAYDLGELAHMVLEKADRFVMKLRPLTREGEIHPLLYISTADNLPFLNEHDAMQHSLKNLEAFFDIESTDCEPPKGSFSFIYECPKTGVLITPPNYHKAQEFLRSFHMSSGATQSFDAFQNSLKKNSDPEKIQAWLNQMSKKTIYKSKLSGDEAITFDNLLGAHNYLNTHFKSKLVKAVDHAYLSGHDLEKLPEGSLKSTLQRFWQIQKRNSFGTINYLRGRLKQLGFSIFKRSGQSYVCAVKRKLRTVGLEFSASIGQLIAFLEQNPDVLVSELAEKYLQIPAATPEVPHSPEQDQKIKVLMQDLYWLIREGYLTEFNNGKLLLSPFEPDAKGKKPVDLVAADEIQEPKEIIAQESLDDLVEMDPLEEDQVSEESLKPNDEPI